ncbi:MAG: heme ABC exporter ATP-binding protein CcmA [Myxococcota bacterium]|nr:heme ABC exporter ATP-binding protein CcmA [Myxococcota bacterium]
MSEAPLLEVRDVSRRFGRTWAVRRISLSVEPGRLVTLTGHNGSGKSTLLRLMAGALKPTEGEVVSFGSSIQSAGQRIAWLDHRPALYADLSGRENLEFWCALAGHAVSQDSLDSALDRVGLAAVAHRRVRGYSRGMTQRLGLANVLLRRADVWLLDEPSTGLDVDGRETLASLLSEALEANKGVVTVTHNPAYLGSLVDVVHQLDKGRIKAVPS